MVVSTTRLAASPEPTTIADLSTSSTTMTRPSNTFLPYVHTAISKPDGPSIASPTPAYHMALRRRRRRAACTRSDVVQDCGEVPAAVNASISTTTGGACGGTSSDTGSTRATINAVSYEFCKAKFSGKNGRVLHYGDPSISHTTTDNGGNDITLQVLFDWSLNVPWTSITMDVQGCYMGFVSAVSVCGANVSQPLVLGGHFETLWNGVNTFFYVVVKPAAGADNGSAAATVATGSTASGIQGNVIAGATGAAAGIVLVVITALLLFRRSQQGKPVCGASTPTYMSPPRAPSPFPFLESSEKFGHSHQKSVHSTSTKRSGPYPAVAWLYDAFPKPPKVAQDRYSSATTLQAPGPWPNRSLTPMLSSSQTRVRSSPALSPTNTGGFKHDHISWQGDDTFKQQPINRRSAPLLSQTPATPPSPAMSSHRRVQSSNHTLSQWPPAPYLLKPPSEKSNRRIRPTSHVLSPFNGAGIRKPIEAFKRQHRKQQSSYAASHRYSCSIYSRGTCGDSIAPGSRRPTVDKSEDVPAIPAVHLTANNEEESAEEKMSPLRKETSLPEVSLRRSFFGSRKKKRLSRPQLAKQMSAYYAASLESLNRNFSSAMGVQTTYCSAATASAPDLLRRNGFEGGVLYTTAPITGSSGAESNIHPAFRADVKAAGVPDFSSWKAGLPLNELEGSSIPVVSKMAKKSSPVDG